MIFGLTSYLGFADRTLAWQLYNMQFLTDVCPGIDSSIVAGEA